jgi:hypothetical protein
MTDDTEAKFLEAIEKFGHEIFESNPDLKGVLQRFWSGEIDTNQAIKEVWRVAARSPDAESDLQRAMFDAFGVEPQSTDLAHFPDRERMLERWGFDDEDIVFVPNEERPDYKMLHPLLMGMIVELLQFDGDIPELRTGKMPEGGAPAVPVKSVARNPVVVGAMLRTASQEVALELTAAQEEHDQKVAKMIEAVGGAGAQATGLVRQETERGIAVPGYGPGQKAAIREVAAPTGAQLARMPFEERQELAHKALTSTQGRRSAVPIISQMVLDALHARGFTGLKVAVGEGPSLFADVEWTVMIDGGQGERNPNFNFIDTAARALTAKLGKALSGHASRYTSMYLLVAPINTVAERRVGWRAVLYEQGSTASR